MIERWRELISKVHHHHQVTTKKVNVCKHHPPNMTDCMKLRTHLLRKTKDIVCVCYLPWGTRGRGVEDGHRLKNWKRKRRKSRERNEGEKWNCQREGKQNGCQREVWIKGSVSKNKRELDERSLSETFVEKERKNEVGLIEVSEGGMKGRGWSGKFTEEETKKEKR